MLCIRLNCQVVYLLRYYKSERFFGGSYVPPNKNPYITSVFYFEIKYRFIGPSKILEIFPLKR